MGYQLATPGLLCTCRAGARACFSVGAPWDCRAPGHVRTFWSMVLRGKLLVVDDDEDLRLAIQDILALEG